MSMGTENVTAGVLPSAGIARKVISLVLMLVVLGGVAAAIWRFVYGRTYDDASVFVLAHAVAAVALAVLAALPRSTPYLGVVLGLVAIPGVLALWAVVVYAQIIWTGEVHTFASSWGPIGLIFAAMAPVFAPLLGSGVALLLRKRAPRVRVLAVLGVTAGAFFLSLPGYLAF